MNFVIMESYDGKLVRIPSCEIEKYKKSQLLIKKLLKNGDKLDVIKRILHI